MIKQLTKQMMSLALALAALLLVLPNNSYAACTSPAANAGVQIYNNTYNLMQYCDGTNWINMGSIAETDPNVTAFAKSALPTCAAGEALKGDGTTLTCVPVAITSLTEITDVSATAVTNGQALIYNSTTNLWEPGEVGGADAATLDTLDSTQFLRSDQSDTLTGDLTVSGAIKVGTSTTCAAGNAGSLRYSNSAIEYCDGSTWGTIGYAGGSLSGAATTTDNSVLSGLTSTGVKYLTDGIIDEFSDQTGILAPTAPVLVSAASGTVISDGTVAPTNPALAFDGNNVGAYAGTGAATMGASGTLWMAVGKNWGTGVTKTISKVMAYAATDYQGFSTGATGGTLYLEGSADGTTWTTLASQTIAFSTSLVTTLTSTISTSYQYHRLRILEDGSYTASHASMVAEVAFYEDSFGVNNGVIESIAFTAATQPAEGRLMVIHEPVDAVTINTDLKGWVSRDGGTTWSEVTLANNGTFDGTSNILVGTVDLSGQPAGTSMKYKITTHNTKSQKVHAVSLRWGDAVSGGVVTGANIAASAGSLTEIGDVSATAPTDGQALVYDNATQMWIPGTVASAETDPQVGTLTTGQLCRSDGSAVLCDSSAPAVDVSGNIVLSGELAATKITVTGVAGGTGVNVASVSVGGKVAQIQVAASGVFASTSTPIPLDNTIPQSSEGAEYLTVSITPTDASSTLLVEWGGTIETNVANTDSVLAIFRDSTASAIGISHMSDSLSEQPSYSGGLLTSSANSTTTTTFKMRFGNHTGTSYMGSGNGVARYGGIVKNFLKVTELLP